MAAVAKIFQLYGVRATLLPAGSCVEAQLSDLQTLPVSSSRLLTGYTPRRNR